MSDWDGPVTHRRTGPLPKAEFDPDEWDRAMYGPGDFGTADL